MLKAAPDPKDVQDLQFKLHCRLQIFDNKDFKEQFSQHCSLVACASRFGLIFVATDSTTLQVIQVKYIDTYTKEDGEKTEVPRRNFVLEARPSHISVNCDHTILAVVSQISNCPCVTFYDIKSFWKQEIAEIARVRLSATPAVTVTETNWNPTLGAVFTACKSDGSLGIYEIKNSGVDINELPAASGATCFCWSPKGKQIAVGSRDGKITQLKPDLKAVKVINAPSLKDPHSLQSLLWVSNYQFIGVFQSNGQAVFIVVDAPKTGDPVFTNYDDICYSNGNTRPTQFYLNFIQTWNVLMSASSNSMEVGILGFESDSWIQWSMGDAARAELPLSASHQETLPIGMALDIGSTNVLTWGESTLPPAPRLLLLSHYGVLCIFNIINLKEGVPSICSPPDPIEDSSGAHLYIIPQFTSSPVATATTEVSKPVVLPKAEVLKAASLPTLTKQPILNTPTVNVSQPPSLNLFGGQATLIPLSQNKTVPTATPNQSPMAFLPNMKDKNLSSNFLPQAAPMVPNMTSVKPTVMVSSNLAPTVQQKMPIPITATNLTKHETSAKVEDDSDKIFEQLIKEECVFLETELKTILYQGKNTNVNLGTDNEKTKIVESIKVLEDFFNEVLEICGTQKSEIHVLKQNLLQSWAWYEEAKSRHLSFEDESMMILLRTQPLDSASQKQLADLQHLNYYLESQISQAHTALDEQWDSFQDYCKKTHKLQIPTMEMIFQTLVKQNAILRKQSYILIDIANRVKKKSRSSITSLLSVNDLKSLPKEFKQLRMDSDDCFQLQYKHVTNRMKNLTPKKVDSLRSFLKPREYPHISAVKPQLSSSIIQASPKSMLKQHSWSAPIDTPVIKTLPFKKLDFVQSTPIIGETKLSETQSAIEELQNFSVKFESKMNPKPFSSLSNNLINASPNSAFVSTSLVTTTPIKSSLSEKFATSVVKPSFTMTTVASDSNQPVITISTKPFSFAAASKSPAVSTQSFGTNSNLSIFSKSASTPTVLGSSNVASTTITSKTTITTKPSIFSPMSTKPNTITTPVNLTTSTKNETVVTTSSNDVNKIVSSNSIFGTPLSTSNSSFNFTATNTFGSTKVTEASSTPLKPLETTSTPLKPFVFSSKSDPAVSTPSIFSVKSLVATSSTTGSTISLPKTTAMTSSLFTVTTATPANFTTNLGSSTQSPSFNTTVTTKADAFSFDAGKSSSVFSSLSSAVTTTVATSSNIVPSAASINVPTSTISSGTPSSAPVSIFGSQTFSSKPITFGTVTSSTSVTSSAASNITTTTSSTGFGAAQMTKPVFGNTVANSSTSSIFGSTTPAFAATATTKATVPGFGEATTPAPGAFHAQTTTPSFSAKPTVFGTPTTTFGSSSFGSTTTTQSFGSTFGTPTTTQSSIFGGTSPQQNSVFGSTASPGFGTTSNPATTQSIFGAVTSNTPSVFGTSTSQSSIFGSSSNATTTQPQDFGMFASTSQKTSIFGAPTTTSQSVFGSNTQTSVFGNPATTTTSVFGTSSVFGNPATQSSSVFGNPTNTTSSIFGNPTSSTGSVFGNTTTTGSIFGQSSTSSTFGQTSTFGSSGSSVFGSSTFGQTGSVFGGSTPATTSGSVFGAASSTSSGFPSGGSIFGGPTSTTPSVFGASNAFSSNSNQSSPFGATANTGSFGFGGLNVGSTPTTSSSTFGASPSANPFATPNKSVFGSPAASTSSAFGASNPSFGTSSQTFGGGGGFGSQPAFGQQQAPFTQSSFGSSSFGQSSPGPFSGGSGSIAQSGFGTASNFQKTGSFGSPPAFGGSPSFGGTASFGSNPAFGNAPTFGGGGGAKVFGAPASQFGGDSNNQNSGFGNLANQQTLGFGNLAQQANPGSSSSPFGGASSFSSWR